MILSHCLSYGVGGKVRDRNNKNLGRARPLKLHGCELRWEVEIRCHQAWGTGSALYVRPSRRTCHRRTNIVPFVFFVWFHPAPGQQRQYPVWQPLSTHSPCVTLLQRWPYGLDLDFQLPLPQNSHSSCLWTALAEKASAAWENPASNNLCKTNMKERI